MFVVLKVYSFVQVLFFVWKYVNEYGLCVVSCDGIDRKLGVLIIEYVVYWQMSGGSQCIGWCCDFLVLLCWVQKLAV